jgi:hypothetical protein
VLLCFAQYDHELIAGRVRDKRAASQCKGILVHGQRAEIVRASTTRRFLLLGELARGADDLVFIISGRRAPILRQIRKGVELERAVEWRRSSYSPLLLGPGIGQRAGELCEGEIGRRGAVEECRHNPG